jgi:hypothetical protein
MLNPDASPAPIIGGNTAEAPPPSVDQDPVSRNVDYWKSRIEQLVDEYPDLERAAEQTARYILTTLAQSSLSPGEVYWHWFDSANSSARTYTGWEHYGKPKQSMTLVELVMRRFDLDQQRNSDLLAQMGGFYTSDENRHAYNEHNEVRLDPRAVLTYFWQADFASQYVSKLRGFWINHQSLYCTVSKISLLCSATLQCQREELPTEDFMEIYAAVVNDPTSPFRPEKLYGDVLTRSTTQVRSLDIEGIVSQSTLRFCTAEGREILYCPMQHPTFVTFAGPEQLYLWLQSHLTTPESRRRFGAQFVRVEHNKEAQWDVLQRHLSDIAHTPWKTRKTQINVRNTLLDGYAFDFLPNNLNTDMQLDAKYLLMSNSRLDKGLWIGYLESFLKLYGSFSMVGWPIAAASIVVGLAGVALYADKAINAGNERERNLAIRGAVLQAFNVLLTLPLLADASVVSEYEALEIETTADSEANGSIVLTDGSGTVTGPGVEGDGGFDPIDLSERDACTSVSTCSTLDDPPSMNAERDALDLGVWRPALMRSTEFRLQRSGPYDKLLLRNGYEHYAEITGVLYRVRFIRTLQQWAVVDPLNPFGLDTCIPIALDGKGFWRPAARVVLAVEREEVLAQVWAVPQSLEEPQIDVQPPDSVISVEMPLDGVEKVMDRYMVRITGRGQLLAMYDADAETWRVNHLGNTDYLWQTQEGAWQSGDRTQWLEGASRQFSAYDVKTVVLPPLPAPNGLATAIPKQLHYIWIGQTVPDQKLIDNLLTNARRLTGYRSTLHVDLDTPEQLAALTAKFAGHSDFEVRALNDEAFFQELRASEDNLQYEACRTGVAKNYAAASDLVRYRLLDAYGGIYMDVDDTFASVLDNVELPAGPSDLLLDDAVMHDEIPYSGYNSHVLGSHPNNPVLKAIIRAMRERFAARPGFYDKPRPVWSETATSAERQVFWQYVRDTFDMTGPQVLDDVLRENRPDYYDLALRADLRRSLGISSTEYERRLALQVEHYFPFASKVEVIIGNLHSWKSTR